MSYCCPHVTKATGHINDEEWSRIVTKPVCHTCREQGINFWLCFHPTCHVIGCSDADGGQDHSTEHFNENPTHSIQVRSKFHKSMVTRTTLVLIGLRKTTIF